MLVCIKGRDGNSDFRSLTSTKKIACLVIFAALFFSILPQNLAYAGTTFSITSSNLSNSVANSKTPKIAASGSNVYVAWQEGDEIYYSNSTDGGATFGSPINLSNTAGVTSDKPQISISGNNIYVVWREGNANQDIYLRNSTDNGDNFNSALQLSSTAVATSDDPQIASSGTSLYAIWREGSSVFFRNSTGGGPFGSETDLSGAGVTIRNPQLAVSGNNIYTVWREDSNILLRKSTDNGDTFSGSTTTVGTTGGTISPKPEIIADGTTVYIISQNSTNISFKKSTDGAATFAPLINLGGIGTSTLPNQQISISGTNIYVVWEASGDIQFRKSTDSGASFDAAVNLSGTGTAFLPDLAAGGNNVFVTWRSGTAATVDTDTYFKSSTDNGANFDSVNDLSSNTIHANEPQVAASGSDVYITWWEETSVGPDTNDGEIRFSAGTAVATSVVFDAAQYRLSGTATITVTDTASNTNAGAIETIPVTVTSTTDGVGITPVLTETLANSGIFSGAITFTSGASSGTTLHAEAGNTITATFASVSGIASIYPRTVAWDSDPYDRGNIAFITVTDQNSNTNAAVAETIVVTVSSLVAGDSTTLTLTETGVNTGVFGGIADVELIFTEGNDEFPTSGTVTVTIESTAANVAPAAIDSTTVAVKSDSDGVGITLPVTETGINTSIFTGTLTLTTGSSVPSSAIKVAGGDFVNVTKGAFTSNALVVPNPDPSRGLLQVTITGSTPETITASFGGASDVSTVDFIAGEAGGGGGGIVRPGLVLDVLAGTFGGGGRDVSPPLLVLNKFKFTDIFGNLLESDSTKPIAPSTDTAITYPLTINNDGYALSSYSNTIVPTPMEAKKPVDLKLVFYDVALAHVALYFTTGEQVSESDPHITYDNGKIETYDPNGLLGDDVKFTLTKDGTKFVLIYGIQFEKPAKLNLMIRAWDDKRNSGDTKIFDAFNVIESGTISQETTNPVSEKEAGLGGVLSETAKEVQTTPQNDLLPIIKEWGGYSAESASDSELLQAVGIEAEHVPTWFRAVAKWSVGGDVSQQEFVDAIKYMYNQGIIT